MKQNKFPNELKIADITLIFKKEDPLDKTSYSAISILATVSEIFRKNIIQSNKTFFKQISFVSPLLFQETIQYSICLYKPSPKMANVS